MSATASAASADSPFAFAARLAAAALRQTGSTDASRCILAPLAGGDVISLARVPAFRGPLDRVLAARRAWQGLSAARVDAIAASPAGRLALLLATEPKERTQAAAMMVAAAVFQKRVLRLTLKTERERMRDILGADGFRFATQEAPTLHAGLALLDAGDAAWGRIASADAREAQRRLAGVGGAILLRLVAAADPALEALARLRLPADGEGAGEGRGDGPLPAPQAIQLAKLVQRRMASWSAIIG